MNSQKIRRVLGLLAVTTTAGLVYASLVPLTYRHLEWDEACRRFAHIPWLDLKISNRADWVANGIVVIPSAFLFAGACDWGRRSRDRLLVASPLIILLLSATVVGIEFVQLWFPPRVVSLNDIAAGVLGAVGGVLLWSHSGRRILGMIEQFYDAEPGAERIYICGDVVLVGLFVFSVLPLDLILSVSELKLKWDAGRIVLVPFLDVLDRPSQMVVQLMMAAKLVPFAMLAGFRWSIAVSVRKVVLWAIVLEAVQFLVFTRTFSTTDMLFSLVLGTVAVLVAPRVKCIATAADRPDVWVAGFLGWTVITLLGFLSQARSVVRDPHVIRERFVTMLTVPFARAHASTEFAAGQNILIKLIVFGVLAFLAACWIRRTTSPSRKRSFRNFAIIWIGFVALGVECSQIFFLPLVPDTTDFIVYLTGAFIGVLFAKWLLPQQDVRSDRFAA